MAAVTSSVESGGAHLDWGAYNEALVERGDMTRYARVLARWREDLERENAGKPGRPRKLPDTLFQFAALLRVARRIPWRQLQGELRVWCELHGLPVPSYTTLHRRCARVSLEPLLRRVERAEGVPREGDRDGGRAPVAVAVDSTGLKVSGSGEYLRAKHRPPDDRVWVKFHAVVDVETHVVLAGLVTHNGVGDCRAFPELVERAARECEIAEVLADGAYDTRQNFNVLDGLGIEPRIKPRSNASTRSRGCPSRSRVVWEVKKVGLEEWLESVGYARRQAVERLYSRFKIIFGDRVLGRSFEAVVVEVDHKVALLNHYARQLQLVKY